MDRNERLAVQLLGALGLVWFALQYFGAHRQADAQGIGGGLQVSVDPIASPYAHFTPVAWVGRTVWSPETVGQYLAWSPPGSMDTGSTEVVY
jgi:hypothetical protein